MGTFVAWFLDAVPAILVAATLIVAGSTLLVAWRARADGWQAALHATFPDALILVALAAIAVLTLGDPMGAQPDRINLLPFRDEWWALQGQIDPALTAATLLANVALFVPLGAALAARFRQASTWSLVGIAAGVSAVVEIAQAVVNIGRLADVTDVLANTAGAWAGVVLWRVVLGNGRANERSA